MSRPSSLSRQIRDLRKLDRTELLSRYQQLYGKPIPESITRDLLEAAVGYRLQNQLIAQLRHRLVQVLTAGEAIIEAAATDYSQTVLIRTWRGEAHVVTLIDDTEIVYRGDTHPSLESVARLITGNKRSADEFFGTDRPAPLAIVR